MHRGSRRPHGDRTTCKGRGGRGISALRETAALLPQKNVSVTWLGVVGLLAATACSYTHPAQSALAGLAVRIPRDSTWGPALTEVIGKTVRCVDGKANLFDCHRVDLLAYLPPEAIGYQPQQNCPLNYVSNLWGWIDSTTRREFAIVGRCDGTAFVEVTDPMHPSYLGTLPISDGATPSDWRDIKVYQNHAFIVSDGAETYGMQVLDLVQLRSVAHPPVVFRETAHYDRLASVHTIAVNPQTGFLYAVGANGGGETCGGGLHMIDVRMPTRPVFAGCYPETLGGTGRGYVHETQCVVYHGPDRHYRGREICLNAAEKALGIVDVTDKRQPKAVSVATYPHVGYTHQGWLTEDQRYFFLGDELDEGHGKPTRTLIFDLSTLNDPVLVKEFLGTTQASDHNLYIRGHYVYQANYKAGLRILDITDPVNPKEVGYFDTTPGRPNTGGFWGAWGTYPYFKHGVVGISSMAEGLFLVQFQPGATGR